MNDTGWINRDTSEIIIDDIPYAVNLEWRNKQTSSGVAPRITRKLAKENIPHEGIDIFFPFVGNDKMYAQIGYGNSENVSKKSRSLAASLLLSRGGKWVGLFKVDDEKDYLIFINDDLIDPDGDLLLDSSIAENVFKQICEDNELNQDQIIMEISDAESGINSLFDILSEVNARKKPTYKNIDINLKMIHPSFYLITAIGIIALSGYGYYEYQEGVKQAEQEEERQRREIAEYREKELFSQKEEEDKYKKMFLELESKKNAKIKELSEEAKLKRPKPWIDHPNPLELFEYCMQELKSVPLFKSTWGLRSASCNSDNVRSMYIRGDVVSVNSFLSENPNAVVDMLGESATFVKENNQDFSKSQDNIPETPQEYRYARYTLIGVLQNRNLSYNLGASAYNIEPIDGYGMDMMSSGVDENTSNLGISGSSIIDQIRDAANNIGNRVNNRVNNSLNNEVGINSETNLTYKERYENHLTEEEINQMTIGDLPEENLIELNNLFQVDWQTQQLRLSTTSTLDWFKNVIPEINGLRINQINVNISSSSVVEWELIGTFYFKESSNI